MEIFTDIQKRKSKELSGGMVKLRVLFERLSS